MDINEYQELSARTLIDRPEDELSDNEMMLIWNALGLAGEAGEVVDLIKKGVFHKHGVDKEKVTKELGDVLWYIAALCTKLGVPRSKVLEANVEKLQARYPQGFTSNDSINRRQ